MTLYGAAKSPVGFTKLTGDAGGTANGALEDVSTVVDGVDGTGSNAASKVDVDARLVSIANNLDEINEKLNALHDLLVRS